MLDDRKIRVYKYLTITQEPGITGYVWKVDSQFRTVTDTHPADSEGNLLELGVQYKIQSRNGRDHNGNCVGKFIACLID